MSAISEELKEIIRKKAKNRCGYCLTPQEVVSMPLEIEHIHPIAKGGTNDEQNLWMACRNCNGFKQAKTHAIDPVTLEEILLFNPQTQSWSEHFEFSANKSEIIGKTPEGRATVVALRLNFEQALKARELWINAGWYPPKDY